MWKWKYICSKDCGFSCEDDEGGKYGYDCPRCGAYLERIES